MKWLFFILLLANLGMFILIYPQQAEKKVENSLPDVGELYLYHEIAEFKSDQAGVESTSATDEETVDADQEPQATAEQAKSRQEDLPVTPQTAPKPELSTAVAETAAEPEVTAPICRTVGFLESRSDAEIVSVSLRALGLKPDLQSETSNQQAGIWVLIPPQASRRDAIDIAERLERDGVSDLWRFTSGELVHAISLGLFRNQERAEARKKEIADLGYAAIVKPRYRQLTKYWLYFQETTPTPDTKQGLAELVSKFPDLEVQETACR
jgi:hypothetical protein